MTVRTIEFGKDLGAGLVSAYARLDPDGWELPVRGLLKNSSRTFWTVGFPIFFFMSLVIEPLS